MLKKVSNFRQEFQKIDPAIILENAESEHVPIDLQLLEQLAASIEYLFDYVDAVESKGNEWEKLMLSTSFLTCNPNIFPSSNSNFDDCVLEIVNQFQSLYNPRLAPLYSYIIERIELQVTFLLKIIRRQHTFLHIDKKYNNKADLALNFQQDQTVIDQDIVTLTIEVGNLKHALGQLMALIKTNEKKLKQAQHFNRTEAARRIHDELATGYQRRALLTKKLTVVSERLKACQALKKST